MEFATENDLLNGNSTRSGGSTFQEAEIFRQSPFVSTPPAIKSSLIYDSNDERIASDTAAWTRTYSNEGDVTTPKQSGQITLAVSSSSSSPRKLERLGERKVSFAVDTVIKEADTIASSIPTHNYVKKVGHTQYHIQLIFRGFHWSITKRYRDFENFHKQLCAETADAQTLIPELPKKRWFERQRWLNRFDETYSRNRRVALQSYLRTILRTFEFYEKQELFTEFLLIPEEALKVDNNAQYVQKTPVENPFPTQQIDFSEEDPYGSFSYRTYSDNPEIPTDQDNPHVTISNIAKGESEREEEIEQASVSDSDDES